MQNLTAADHAEINAKRALLDAEIEGEISRLLATQQGAARRMGTFPKNVATLGPRKRANYRAPRQAAAA